MTKKVLTSWCATAMAMSVGATMNVARAQTTPAPLFQNATLTGSGNTITATRVPVMLSTTLIVYVDVTLQFTSDSNGNLTLATGFPQYAPSASLLTPSFKAGTYLGPSTLFGGNGLLSVNGPSVADGGATMWSLTTAPGTNVGVYPTSVNWWVGPIANNPYAARIAAAKITSTAYSYGVASTASSAPGPWVSGSNGILIGVSQTGNVLSIASFSFNGASDTNTPYAILTFTLQ
jgi:hypothetical protein